MAEKTQTEKDIWNTISQSTTKGVKYVDKMSDSLVDTIAPGNSQLDNLVSDFSNSTMLSNLLTSNSPTLNVKQGLEELCEFIAEFDPNNFDLEEAIKKFFNKLYKVVRKIIVKICQQLISAIYNAVLKLRRMVISKLKSFLAEYVADACISGLQDHLEDLMNPKNALSISEMTSSIEDMLTDVGKNIDDTLKNFREFITTTYSVVVGTAYLFSKSKYEAEFVELQNDLVNSIVDVQTMFDSEAVDAKTASQYNSDIIKIVEEIEDRSKKVALAEFAKEWWTEKWKQTLQLLYEMACSRTASYVQSENFGLTGGIQAEIKEYMQGCLFQQALKTSKKIDPDGLSANVLNRINNLAKNGSMLDAYNVALAAGIDLSSSQFQIELPSSNGWVSKVYGDPYMFAPETPLNSAQVAQYLTSDLPSMSELLDGKVDEEKQEKEYVAENWNEQDASAAAVSNRLIAEIQANRDIIEGQESTGKTMSITNSTIRENSDNTIEIIEVTKTASVVKETTREEVVEKYV